VPSLPSTTPPATRPRCSVISTGVSRGFGLLMRSSKSAAASSSHLLERTAPQPGQAGMPYAAPLMSSEANPPRPPPDVMPAVVQGAKIAPSPRDVEAEQRRETPAYGGRNSRTGP